MKGFPTRISENPFLPTNYFSPINIPISAIADAL